MSTIIHTSPLPDVVIPDQSITDCVLSSAAEHADEVAITDGDASSYTFSQLHGAVRSLGGGLSSQGVGPGTTVGILAPNIPEYAIAFHGTALAGGTVTTINPTYRPEEVAFQLRDAAASLLVTIPMFLETARAAAQGTDVEEIVVMARPTAPRRSHRCSASPSTRSPSTTRTMWWCCPTRRAPPDCPRV